MNHFIFKKKYYIIQLTYVVIHFTINSHKLKLFKKIYFIY
jgi:hypothetical protein